MLRKCACLLALGFSLASPAAALPSAADRTSELLEGGAHSQAALELARRIPGLRGAERDRAQYLLGQARKRLGDLAGAEDALARVPAESPWYPRAAGELAELYALQGKHKRAMASYRAQIATLSDRDALPVRLKLGDALLEAREYEGAILAYRPLHDCDDPGLRESAWYGAGWAATRAGLHARALWFWHQAIREFPTSRRIREARLNLANHYLRMGRLGFAAEQLRAVGADPAEADADSIALTAEFVAAEAAASGEDWVRAIDAYRRASKSPRWAEPSAYGVGYALWQAGRIPEAEDAFLTCLEAYPKGRFRAAARYGLGRVLQESGRGADAREAYLAGIAAGKTRWGEESLFQLAAMELAAGKPAEAMKWCRRLTSEYPGGRLALPGLWLLAESQLASGAISDAISSYGRLARKPESLSFLEGRGNRVMFKLGLAYFKAGDIDSAEAAFREVRGDAGGVAAEALFWRAEALYRLGRFGESADLYETVVARHGESSKAPEAAYGLGWAELRRGRRGPAMWAFKQAAPGLLDRDLKRDAYHRLAMLQLDAGAYKEAQASLRQVLALDEGADPTEGAFYLAWSQMKAEDLDDALKGFAALADARPATTRGRQARLFQAQILLGRGQYLKAARAFEALIGLPPLPGSEPGEDPRVRAAGAYLSAGEASWSEGLYALVAGDAVPSPEVRRGVLQPLASAYLQSGALARAESVLTGAASGDPWVPAQLVKVAEAYGKQGRWREAAATYAAVPGSDDSIQMERARALRRGGDLAAAAEAYKKLADTARPDGPVKPATVLFELFDTYEEGGRFDVEREVLERLEKTPGVDEARLAEAWYRYGETIMSRGDPVQAEQAFRLAEKRLTKGTVQAWKVRYALGNALVGCKRYEDALFELSSLTAAKAPAGTKEPLTAFRGWKALAWLKQGEALERMRRWEEAQAIYQTVGIDTTLPERERQEAQARSAWIKTNVRRQSQP